MRAIWNGEVIAHSDDTIVVEDNHYFPAESVNMTLLKTSDSHTRCPWKGEASYYSIVVDDKINTDAAWFYPEPEQAAANIKDRIAFWKGVEVKP